MLIESISLEGFKAFQKTHVQLGKTNLLLGANGAGKSSLLEALNLFPRVLRSSSERFRLQGQDFRYHHHGAKRSPEFRVTIKQAELSYSLRFEASHGESWLDDQSVISKRSGGRGWQNAGFHECPEIAGAGPLLEALRDLEIHQFHDTSASAAIRRPCSLYDNRKLRHDGSNLPAILYLLRATSPHAYRTVVKAIQVVAPWFDDFILEPLRLQEDQIKLEWRHRTSDGYFDAFSFSDGSLRFISLCTLLLHPSPPPLLLLDEPELGLHPTALFALAELLRTVESQIIVATQSAALVDQFELQDIVVCEYSQGAAQLRRPPAAELKSWLKDYSLGTLWEKNLLGGRP